jgi:DnaK suppressor protein
MSGLTKAKIKHYEKVLKDRLAELLVEADHASKEISEESRDRFADPTDQAAVELDRSRLLRFRDRERKLIRKIEIALLRIEEGSYGSCDSCGAQIETQRLEARPMTELCIDCATEAEGEKKRRQMEAGNGPAPAPFA